MFKRYTEYREMQQLRKDHLMKQKLRYLGIFFVVMLALLLVVSVMEVVKPAEATKPVKTEQPSAPVQTEEPSVQDEWEFSAKQEKYCLNVSQEAGFEEPELTQRIDECLDQTADWPMEKFE